MALIFGMAAAAWAVVSAYNRLQATDPATLEATIKVVKQTTGVVLTLASAVQQILNALALIKVAVPVAATAAAATSGVPRVTAGMLEAKA